MHGRQGKVIGSSNRVAGLLFWLCLALLPGAALGQIHVLVDTENARLDVYDGDRLRVSLDNISIGRFGATHRKRQGDGMTPQGDFRVRWIKRDEKFHYFIGLDYPDRKRADRALAKAAITAIQHRQILSALKQGKLPPQDTPLGGFIGLHGIGQGDPETHDRFNWTRGCVALTNEQVDVLLQWVGIGTRVEIR